MEIGFDISQTGANKAGCGYYAHALAQSLLRTPRSHHFSLFPSFGDFYFDSNMPAKHPYSSIHPVAYGPRHSKIEAAKAFWNQPTLDSALGHLDVVHSNNFWCPIQLKTTRLVYTLYDLAAIINPSWTTEANRVGCFDGIFKAAIAADWMVAISASTKQDFLNTFPHYPEERVQVIYPCSRFTDSTPYGYKPEALEKVSEDSFWLSVSTIEPRKNQKSLVKAYARYKAAVEKPMPLVFAGGKGWLMDDFQLEVTQLGLENDIIFTGYVQDEELIWLYRNCYASLYPSLYEGFGLPILEGMQFGAACVVSNSSSMPEVAGEAAIALSPHDIDAWADTLIYLAQAPDHRNKLKELSRVQAAQFSWEVSAHMLLDLYEEVIKAPKFGFNFSAL